MSISSTSSSPQGSSSKPPTTSATTQNLPPWASWIGSGGPPPWTNGGPPWNRPTPTASPATSSTADTTSTNTTSSQAPATATAPVSVTASSGSVSQHRTVSTAEIAGIVVAGVVVAVLLLVGCILMRRRCRRPKVTLPFHSNELVMKNTNPLVQPYTLTPTSVPVYGDLKSKHWVAESEGVSHDAQIRRDTQPSNAQRLTPAFPSNTQQALSIDVETSPVSRPGTQDIQHLSAQVATLQHQVLHIQMQSNPPYYSPSPSIEAPPSYLVSSTATNTEHADEINEHRKFD